MMMSTFRSLQTFLLLATVAFGASVGPVADLTLTSNPANPDGSGLTRDAIVFVENDSVIGPLIKGTKGDTFQLNLINNLDNDNMRKPTSIHWHGILQDSGNAWADGPAFITQCPIAGGGHAFQYEFTEPNQAGTFWYHSHLSTQYCDGARGPFVIYDPADPHASLYDVDDESTVITIADWYHQYAKLITGVGNPDANLINGLGRFAGAGGTASELTVITVEQGKKYRLRFVNIACDPWYRVSIDGHPDLTIIEADSVNTVEVPVDSFDIFAGQRYSVVLNANNDISNYWIRVSEAGTSSFAGGIDSAILRYVGAPAEDPTTPFVTPSNRLSEQSLTPLLNPGAPGTPTRGIADVTHNINVQFTGGKFLVDGVTFVPPTIPVLLQLLSGAATAQSLLPTGSFIPISQGDVVEISFGGLNNVAGSPHPIHLHGHTFDVIRSATGTTDNYINPPRRDVVSTGSRNDGSNVTIRFVADNPGPWFLHCHIDWHLELGLAMFFAESADQWTGSITPPSEWDQLCPTYDALDAADQ